ncbi:MAG: glycosyltransferase family 2 protein, partial [Nonlabens sp.]|nr:glycosyltransferase family 2 protein [Nonlabens sp.]
MSLNIVIPNRNRDLAIVKRSLDTLAAQLNERTQVTVVDYGSALAYQLTLQELIKTYKGIDLILCPTQGQLWNKSRCINMVLKTCETTHFMVCDMDMLWNPDFLKIHLNQLPQDHAVYFTVGVMT